LLGQVHVCKASCAYSRSGLEINIYEAPLSTSGLYSLVLTLYCCL